MPAFRFTSDSEHHRLWEPSIALYTTFRSNVNRITIDYMKTCTPYERSSDSGHPHLPNAPGSNKGWARTLLKVWYGTGVRLTEAPSSFDSDPLDPFT